MTTPHKKLVKILRLAYSPCCGFTGACSSTAKWKPECGHVPRGFVGALGRLKEIKVVILLDKPGQPFWDEEYLGKSKLAKLKQTSKFTFSAIEHEASPFQKRLKYLLNYLFPDIPDQLDLQLRKTWITETYLCSIRPSKKDAPPLAKQECVDRYLAPQLELLPRRPVIALGGFAYKQAQELISDMYLKQFLHPSARYIADKDFRREYKAAAEWARSMF